MLAVNYSWEQRKLGELVQFSKGKGYSKGDLKESGTPIILYGRLYTKYETVITDVDTFVDEKTGSVYSSGGEVIVPASGETAEDISIASAVEKPGVLLGGDLNIITPPANLDSAFLAISISNGKPHNDMAKMAQGKSVVHLHNTDLEKIDLAYPNHEEQARISGFFGSIDNLITLHQCKAYSNIMAVLLVITPKFYSWEQRKFGDLVEEFRERTKTENEDILLSCAIEGMFLNTELFGHQRGASNVGYLKIKKNDLILSAQNLHLGNANVNFRFEHGIISPAYKTYHIVGCSPEFLATWIKRDEAKRFFDRATTVGASLCRKNIDWESLYDQEIAIPGAEEQSRIGAFLVQLDEVVTLHQCQ